MLVGTVQRDSSEFFKRFIPEGINYAKTPATKIAAMNPVITDQSMRPQTDLAYLFSQNPDISGLSLVMDDTARQDRLDTVSFEDFVEPKDSYDIFDLHEFVEQAKSSFNSLPVAFRMQYDNNPINFVQQFNDPVSSSKTIAALSDVLGRRVPETLQQQSSETSNVLQPSASQSAPSQSSTDDNS